MKRILSVFLAFLLSISVTRAEIPRGIYISGDFLGDSMRLVRENQLNPDGEEGMFATRRLILCAEDLSKSYHEFDYTDIVRDSEGFVVLQFGSGEDAEDAYNQLLADDEIEFVEPDILFHVFDEVVDEYNAQAEFSAADVAHNSWGVARIGAGEYADALIANGQGNEAQIVAVVDTGIDTTHSIFTDRVVSGRNTFSNNYNYADGHGHGTHVSGTILDVTRSLPNVKIMPIKALDNNGDGSSITIAAGINWAVDNGADVVNLSLTGTGAPGNFINAYYAKAIQAGVSAVAAAGNDNIVTDNVVPAGIEYSITVAATGNSLHADVKASFSNYGDAVDVAAPGYGILSAHLSGLTATMNGTSMAAPHVSGAVAMLRIRHPEATAAQIEEFVRLYTDDLGTAGWDKYFGYGILNLQKALDESGDFIDGGSTEPEIPVPTYGVSFEANGGTPGPGTQSVPLDGLVLKPTSPVKSGFTFAGWFTSGSLETLWDFTSDTVSGAMTLYAKWIEVITIDGIPKHEYTGEEIEPSVTVRQGAKTLEESVDYTVSYNDNLSLGMALAKISFIGDYLGVDMMSVEFEIVTVDEEYNSVAGTLDGGYVVVGEANRASDSVGYGNNGNYDAIIVKYDVDDNVVWTKNAGGGDNDSFYDVVAMSDGSIVAVGESDGASTSPGWGNNGDADAVIVKYNSAGGVVWSKNAGGDEYDAFRGVTETSDGGIIAVGISNSSSGPFPWGHYAVYDAIIVKYDSSGNMVWAHHAGGISIDAFEEVAAVNDGGCIAVGYSFSTSTVPVWGNSGAVDGIIVRYAANGDVVWSKNIGGTGYDYFDSIAATVDGGFAVVGVSDGAPASSAWGNNGDNDAIIVKYDSAGNVLWAGNVGGANAEEFCGVAATSDGGAVAVGYSYSESTLPEWGRNVGADDVIVKYDAAGNASLAKNVGGSGDEVFFAVAEIANGSYIAAGYAAKDPTDSPYYQNYSRTAGITADFNYVDYDANGGAPEPTPQMMTADGTVEQPTGLVNAGLMFAGWFVDSSFVTLWNFASYVVTGAVTFYARWISEITIDSVPNQEHTGGEIKPIITVRQGFSELTVDQDYEVDYSDNVDIGTATVEISFKGDYLGVEPMSVGFEIIEPLPTPTPSYDVTFDADDGAPAPTSQSIILNGSVAKPISPIKAGFTFAGWFASGSFVTLWNFTSDVVTEAMTLYVKWISEITIDSVSNQEHTGVEIKPIITVRQGFSELTVDQDYEVDYSDNVDIGTATAEISFKGDYLGVEPMSVGFEIIEPLPTPTPSYDVTFDADDGAPEPDAQSIILNGSVIKPISPIKAGFTFAGWFANNSLVTLWNFTSDVVTEAMTLYAKWVSEITIDGVLNQEHTGGEIKPIITVRQGFSELTMDEDYEVDYSDNVDIGTATVEISFKGDYLGVEPMSVGFEITEPEPTVAQSPTPSPTQAPTPSPTQNSSGGGGSGGGGGGGGGTKASPKPSPTPSSSSSPTPAGPSPTPSSTGFTLRFSDVGGHWAESDIYDMVARGIVDGMGNGTFAPDREITRAELVKLLAVISGGDIGGEASFVDVPADEWYSGYIAWAEASKVVNGYDNFMFMPNQTVTRQEMAVMIVRYLDYKGIQMPETGANYEFADGDEISDWALEAIGTAQRTGLLEGVEVEQNMRFIYPKNSTTRAEATTVLLRLIKRVD